MDEFFDGFDFRLKMSGMVADSIMMRIVNSGMEKAYEKVCSKEGDLERLNEKSRFCELAIMQLEWCLKFLQEEMDSSIVENSHEHENLVSDFMETRDRIQSRLKETELAIAEKDRELTERMENEWKLRQALELKDEELSYVGTILELERTKSDRVRDFVFSNHISGNNDRDDFCGLKNSIDQQFWSIKQKIEDVRAHLTNGMRTLNPSSSNTMKLESELELGDEGICCLGDMDFSVKSEVQNDGCKEIGCYDNDRNPEVEVLNCCPRTALNVAAFEQMGADIDILKEMLELAFETMDNAISFSKMGLLEQQWEGTVEKETFAIVLRSYLRDVKQNFKEKDVDEKRKVPLCISGENWSCLMNDITSLRHELELLVTDKEVHSKNIIGCDAPRKGDGSIALKRCGKSDSALKFEELCPPEFLPEEDSVGHANHYVAEMIRNQESIINKKTQEINWLKGEIIRERGHLPIRKDKDLDTVMKRIPEVILRLDSIIKGQAKLGATGNDNQWELHKKFGNVFCHSLPPDFTEEIRQLKKEREDLEMQTMIVEETYMILFKGLVKELNLEVEKYNTEAFMRDDLNLIPIREMVREWNSDVESYNIESFIREEIYRIVFSEVVKDIECSVNITIAKCQETWNDVPSANKFVETPDIGDWDNLIKEPCSSSNIFDVEEELVLNETSELIENDDALDLVNSKLEKSLKQIIMTKEQLRELGSSLGIAVGNWDEAHKQMRPLEGILQDSEHSLHLPNREKKQNELDSMVTTLTDFSIVITDFECMVHGKIGVNIARLEEVNCQLNPLIHHVSALRKKEFLYRKAFRRRCYDLQIAEAEVDLLGDEVDSLIGLLEKTYIALDHYSPVLQHYSGVFKPILVGLSGLALKDSSLSSMRGLDAHQKSWISFTIRDLGGFSNSKLQALGSVYTGFQAGLGGSFWLGVEGFKSFKHGFPIWILKKHSESGFLLDDVLP
ncbi:WPP domain-associated protein-like isoform X1 [Tasmannia lanceolata]|uniref:WPP domain-associated protein-like isoform X1 n=1 Tax=Tasmannia lanceolata TaxID=3420 RepID=UPI004063F3D2